MKTGNTPKTKRLQGTNAGRTQLPVTTRAQREPSGTVHVWSLFKSHMRPLRQSPDPQTALPKGQQRSRRRFRGTRASAY